MPLIYRSELPNGLIVLWKIDESETELRSLCTPQERIYALRAPHDREPSQRVAGMARAAARSDASGRNRLRSERSAGAEKRRIHRRKSHEGYAAVIIAKTLRGRHRTA
ncbi:MAG: hypothetical protein ACLUEV_07985 [Alistipes sp.]